MVAQLIVNPVFILSSIRAGSTLLRCILNAHSVVVSPHELHLREIKINSDDEFLKLALESLEISSSDLKFMLWERIYYELLTRSNKRMIVDKTPSNLYLWEQLSSYWPKAKFILLIRDPAAVARSIIEADDNRSLEDICDLVYKSSCCLDEARKKISNPFVITYEELTTMPEAVITKLCSYLEINYEQGMLVYGNQFNENEMIYGLGDWKEKIKTGSIQKPNLGRVDPKISEKLFLSCKMMGYI